MKLLVYMVLPLLFISCAYDVAPPRSVSGNIIQETDDEQHEIIILDPGFQSWLISNAKPIGFYTLKYYETKNALYVSSWNRKAHSSRGPITNEINYDVNQRYGLDVNYQLYWYFKYIESIYGRRFFFN
ncbi:MAG: DUF6146 family protein [Bacteroidota bacterium]